MWETIMTALLLCSVILSIIALVCSIYSIAKIVGFERSTHRVEYKDLPTEQGFPELTDEQRKSILSNEWMDDLVK